MSPYPLYPTKYNSPKYRGPDNAVAYRHWWWKRFRRRTLIWTIVWSGLFIAVIAIINSTQS